jgi:acetyltransferase-like isoleucine patch superfamily enzyme
MQRRRVGLYIKSALCTVWLRAHGFQSSLVACEGMLPTLVLGGTVRLGKRVILRSRVARCEIGAERDAVLEIGDGVFINQGATIAAQVHITIGRNTQIGDFAAVYDSNYHRIDPQHPVKRAPVVIGENVWLGRAALVLPGSAIGDHTVVAAGSVVNGDLPPRVLAAGNPAQIVKKLEVPDGWRRG